MALDNKLSAEAVLILTSLADGPKHGYAIQLDIARVSGRQLGPGSLYGAIARLETSGYIAPTTTEGARRPYRLTTAGSRALAEEVARLTRVTNVARRRLAAR